MCVSQITKVPYLILSPPNETARHMLLDSKHTTAHLAHSQSARIQVTLVVTQHLPCNVKSNTSLYVTSNTEGHERQGYTAEAAFFCLPSTQVILNKCLPR